MLAVAAGVAFLLALFAPLTFAAAGPMVSLVISDDAAKPVQHGLGKLRGALQAKGASVEETASLQKANGKAVVVAGLASGAGEAARLIAELKLSPPKEPESLLIRRFNRDGKTVLLLVGADARGLMYALLDVADRVGWAKSAEQPFSEVRDTEEKPYAPERALSIYTFNRAYWESRFYDEAYWARYLDVLAQNRFNSLVVIFGYENGGFLAPCYPYFFDVEGFPDVRMVGITPEQQQRNLAALNRLIQMAHDRGVKFTAGIWDHIYRGGVQGGGIPGADEATKKPTPGLVWGVTAENLVPYTKAALAKFVKEVPALDAIQFRMHDESGLKNSEQEAFWRDVFQMMKTTAPSLRLDLRAKGLPDSVIQSAVGRGRALPDHDQVLDGANGPAVSSHAHQQAEPVRSPPFLCRHAPLSAALPDALAPLERRHGARAAVGRSGLCAALRRKHSPLRWRRLRGERTALHEDGGPAARREAVRPADASPPLLRLRVRALLAFLPGVWPVGLQHEHAAGDLAAGVRETVRQRRRTIHREGAA